MLDQKKSIWSWAMYDWANSAFATTVMAGFFPIFFSQYWSANVANVDTTARLGFSNSIASLIVALLAPFLGAIADKGTAKKKFLMTFAFLGILMTGALFMVKQGNWQIAALMYILGTVGFSGANIFYDSLLPGVASEKKIDFVSSLGFAMGYIGGGLLFLVNVVMYLKPELFGIPDGSTAIRIAFLSVALWWAVFSLPIILWVKEPKYGLKEPGVFKAVKAGWLQLVDTFREIRHLKVVGMFLLAYWFYIDGVDTIIRMALSIGTALGFPASALIVALLITQFVAFFGSLLYGQLAKKIGPKRSLYVGIVAYSLITMVGFFMSQVWHFYALAVAIGLFQGGIQAISRSYYSRIIPVNKSAEFYGFFNLLGKFAAVIGPSLMGIVGLLTRNAGDLQIGRLHLENMGIRLSVLSVLLLFIIGGLLLRKVDEKEGKENVQYLK
ncbi:MAG: MFS transporter [Candidatus Marinimicrobia bacterium]|nr:MFS transporter [Candidatus Neomarinimicrobiota bacterium]MDD4961458.1 MFS transporter [Candidatus Neomarinimicrobiota bacterium]MDD5709038.1 MFS transporter [Candidatus Neomarinimicrobiota bacterium]